MAAITLIGEASPFAAREMRILGYTAVAWTMRLRWLSPDPFFPDTYKEIIEQPGQYDGYWLALQQGVQPGDEGGEPRRIAEEVFSGRTHDPTNRAFFFLGAPFWDFDKAAIYQWEDNFTLIVEGDSRIGNPFEGLYFSPRYYKDW